MIHDILRHVPLPDYDTAGYGSRSVIDDIHRGLFDTGDAPLPLPIPKATPAVLGAWPENRVDDVIAQLSESPS